MPDTPAAAIPFDEPAFTSSLRDNLLDAAADLLRHRGVSSVGLIRLPDNANEALRCSLHFEGDALEERLQAFASFREQAVFVWPRLPAGTTAAIKDIGLRIAWLRKPIGDAPGGGLDANGLRLHVIANCTCHPGTSPDTRELARAMAAFAFQRLIPQLPWLEATAVNAPRGYGCRFLLTATELKEHVMRPDAPLWWA
ncbi:hypothetical protein [Rhodanobacter sp. FW106-PBR-R2A-1-13]|uniref:hypothetical protein n=1 Tax=Rhodanobacter sp. FW106-PBR-R2A-1-13 TaxID=3454845 RepID=UPI0034E3A2A9